MIIYFSGTGNSRYAAEFLSRQLSDEILDAGMLIKAGGQKEIRSETPFVFVSPTYAWRMPRVFSDFIRNTEMVGNRNAYFVLTCGGDIGSAGSYAADLCFEKGLEYRGVLEVVMPENYIIMFKAPEKEECRDIIKAAGSALEQGSALIRSGLPFPVRTCRLPDRLKSGIINSGFYTLYAKSKDFYATDQCIACGKCTAVCPLNNITLLENRPVWGRHCTHCMACICGCPVQAVEYGKKTIGKLRYVCPEE